MMCEHCGVSGAKPLAAPAPQDAKAVDPVVAESRGIRPREVMITAMALIGSAVITLALLNARGSVTATAAAPAPTTSAPVRPPVPARPAASAARWIENRAQWTGNDRKSLAFELPSRTETPVWMRNVRPLLVVRCLARRMDVFVFTDSAAAMEKQDTDHAVRIAFDGGSERTERWPDSEGHDALFAPDARAFADRLIRARTMRFGYTPHNAAPVFAEFDLAGLAERMSPTASECGGRKQLAKR
jgi:hypothetical protein